MISFNKHIALPMHTKFSYFLYQLYMGNRALFEPNPFSPLNQFVMGLQQGFYTVPYESRGRLVWIASQSQDDPIDYYLTTLKNNTGRVHSQPPYIFGIYTAMSYIFRNDCHLLHVLTYDRNPSLEMATALEENKKLYAQVKRLTQNLKEITLEAEETQRQNCELLELCEELAKTGRD